jgi:hypothetical protein
MTMQFPVADQTKVNDPLFHSAAEWVSPGYDDEIFTHGRHPMEPGSPPTRWLVDPPANDGRKVVITDTDHYSASADALWAWKSFLRGHHPILMDYGLIGGLTPSNSDSENSSPFPFEAYEPARYAMGDTLRYAGRIGLIDMEPHSELSSTSYVIANPGEEYLILQPSETAGPFTVELAAGSYMVEWFSVNSRETSVGSRVMVESPGSIRFSAPFEAAGPAVLYLKKG